MKTKFQGKEYRVVYTHHTDWMLTREQLLEAIERYQARIDCEKWSVLADEVLEEKREVFEGLAAL